MATCSCHWLIMGKNENSIYCYLTADILTKVLQKCSWSSPLPHIHPKFDWLPWQPKGKLCEKNIKKSTPQEMCGGYSWNFAELSQIFASTKDCILLPLLKHFGCYGNLKFLLACNGKSESWDLLLSHSKYFDKSFTEMFVEWSSTKHIILDQTCQFDWLPWQPKC